MSVHSDFAGFRETQTRVRQDRLSYLPILSHWTTVPESEFSSQTVSQRLRESRSAFNLD